jgi:hypothetical protein
MLGAYAKYSSRTGRGNPIQLREILARLWADLAGARISEGEVDIMIEEATGLIPGEDDRPWVLEQGSDEDAVSAVLYSLRSRKSGLPEEAAWAAACAGDALDDFAINRDDIDTNVPGSGGPCGGGSLDASGAGTATS